MKGKKFDDPLVQWLEGKDVFVKRYLKEAELQDGARPVVEPVGYNHVQSALIMVWDSWLLSRPDIQSLFRADLLKGLGYYRHLCIETILPWFWIEFIIFFPLELSKFLGIPSKNWGSRLADLIYKACLTVLVAWSLYSKFFLSH